MCFVPIGGGIFVLLVTIVPVFRIAPVISTCADPLPSKWSALRYVLLAGTGRTDGGEAAQAGRCGREAAAGGRVDR